MHREPGAPRSENRALDYLRAQRSEQLDARVPPAGANPEIEAASRPDAGKWARFISATLGAWLIVSAFAFPQADPSRTNAWVVGLVIVAVDVGALTVSAVRALNTIAALWLLLSVTLVFETASAMRWNAVAIALAVLVASLVPTRPRYARRRR
jgi:hypothetical protein